MRKGRSVEKRLTRLINEEREKTGIKRKQRNSEAMEGCGEEVYRIDKRRTAEGRE